MTLCTEWSLVKTTPAENRCKPLYCRSWGCPVCRPRRKAQLLALASSGAPNRFLTLTVNPSIATSPEERLRMLSHAWRTLVKRLRREHGNDSINYLAVVEQTKRGEPHLHILLRSPYIPQSLISAYMRHSIDSPIVDIRVIKSLREVVRYVAKYITKAPHQFGSAKRYWCTPAYELDKDSYEKDPEGPSYRWQLSRLSLSEVVKEWRYAGFMVSYDFKGGARGVLSDEARARRARPPPSALPGPLSSLRVVAPSMGLVWG